MVKYSEVLVVYMCDRWYSTIVFGRVWVRVVFMVL